ncbi:MAG: LptA/OstA family protein [Candidatus Hatepunaea meridiana]|nr:LptA/OstA family protein [Candidatus Hatepunaea meridiana]
MRQIYFVVVLFVCPLMAATYEGNAERIVLEHADTLRSSKGVRHLIGNVRIRKGETVIIADRAKYNPNSGQVNLTGKVVMQEPERRIDANRVSYNELSGDFEAVGDVDIVQGDSLRLRCRIARYYKENETVDLSGNVIIDILSDNSRITGDHGNWNQIDDSAIIDQNPVYKLPDEEGESPDTLAITSDILYFNRDKRTALFTGNVVLTRDDMRAVADSLRHLPDSSLTILSGKPVIWQNDDELTGDLIELQYAGRKLEKMFVIGSAQVLSKPRTDDARRNYVTGEKLELTTINDSTRIIYVEGNAQGEYHIWDENGNYRGVNISASDSIELTIVLDKTTSVILEGRAKGVFYPPEDVPEGVGLRETNIFDDKEFREQN